MNIRPIAWTDTGLMWANFRLRYYDRLQADGPVLKLHLRDDDRGDLPILTGERKFGSAVDLLNRLRHDSAPLFGGRPADISSAWIECLQPNADTPWLQDDEPELFRLHIALATNPMALFYCGGDAAQMAVGWINYVNTQAKHSAVNFGKSARVHLVVNVRRPSEADV